MGQGFTAVAEQVGSLAEQSSSATQEIAQIVASIQTETQEVVESIETGTAQVVNSTNLVEGTKRRLAEVLLKSEQINELMQKISASTAYQTESSAAVTQLVKQATEESEQRSESSGKMAQSIQATAEIAQALQTSVEKFKVDDEGAIAPEFRQPLPCFQLQILAQPKAPSKASTSPSNPTVSALPARTLPEPSRPSLPSPSPRPRQASWIQTNRFGSIF
ncbi:MAG: hypothetical protein HC771_12570 [Synechococcales cyanobacterium CRU_2_2]|nr:hypothetical protein [Synechococcales cyanobacterium CRU_2_2]